MSVDGGSWLSRSTTSPTPKSSSVGRPDTRASRASRVSRASVISTSEHASVPTALRSNRSTSVGSAGGGGGVTTPRKQAPTPPRHATTPPRHASTPPRHAVTPPRPRTRSREASRESSVHSISSVQDQQRAVVHKRTMLSIEFNGKIYHKEVEVALSGRKRPRLGKSVQHKRMRRLNGQSASGASVSDDTSISSENDKDDPDGLDDVGVDEDVLRKNLEMLDAKLPLLLFYKEEIPFGVLVHVWRRGDKDPGRRGYLGNGGRNGVATHVCLALGVTSPVLPRLAEQLPRFNMRCTMHDGSVREVCVFPELAFTSMSALRVFYNAMLYVTRYLNSRNGQDIAMADLSKNNPVWKHIFERVRTMGKIDKQFYEQIVKAPSVCIPCPFVRSGWESMVMLGRHDVDTSSGMSTVTWVRMDKMVSEAARHGHEPLRAELLERLAPSLIQLPKRNVWDRIAQGNYDDLAASAVPTVSLTVSAVPLDVLPDGPLSALSAPVSSPATNRRASSRRSPASAAAVSAATQGSSLPQPRVLRTLRSRT